MVSNARAEFSRWCELGNMILKMFKSIKNKSIQKNTRYRD